MKFNKAANSIDGTNRTGEFSVKLSGLGYIFFKHEFCFASFGPLGCLIEHYFIHAFKKFTLICRIVGLANVYTLLGVKHIILK